MEEALKIYKQRHGISEFRPKAVFFDMDGVIYDSMPNHAKAWKEAMKIYGITMTDDDVYASEGARGVDTIMKMVYEQQGKFITKDEAQKMYDRKTAIFHSLKKARTFYGVKTILAQINKDNVLTGIVTGSGQKPLIKRLIAEFEEYIDPKLIITAYNSEKGKPDPDPYLMAMQQAGDLCPHETIVVENSPLGIRSAVAAGCFTIAVNTGPLPDEALLAEKPDFIIGKVYSLCYYWPLLMGRKLEKPIPREHQYPFGTREKEWLASYNEVMEFMQTNQRRPSKHYLEDRKMFEWFKYHRQQMQRGLMPKGRIEKFQEMLRMAEELRHINQYWTANGKLAKREIERRKQLLNARR